MTTWFICRHANHTIASIYSTPQPGVAEEAMDDSVPELAAWLAAARTLPDFSNIDNLDKTFRALGLMIANFTGKTPAQVKQAFTSAWNSLP